MGFNIDLTNDWSSRVIDGFKLHIILTNICQNPANIISVTEVKFCRARMMQLPCFYKNRDDYDNKFKKTLQVLYINEFIWKASSTTASICNVVDPFINQALRVEIINFTLIVWHIIFLNVLFVHVLSYSFMNKGNTRAVLIKLLHMFKCNVILLCQFKQYHVAHA